MKSILILLFISGIMISGCISNPVKQVDVVHINVTFLEKEGFVEFADHKITQGTVNYLGRPRTTQVDSFPAITARTMINKGENSTIGPWETLPYKGNGTYSFNIGFRDDNYPLHNDKIIIYIYVWDGKGSRIGYLVQDLIWE